MTAPTSLTIRLGMCLAPALICASLLGGCVGASQVSETSNEPGDKSPNAGQQQQQGIGNVTLAYAGGAVGLGGVITLIAWLLARNSDNRIQYKRDDLEIKAENERLRIVLDAMGEHDGPKVDYLRIFDGQLFAVGKFGDTGTAKWDGTNWVPLKVAE